MFLPVVQPVVGLRHAHGQRHLTLPQVGESQVHVHVVVEHFALPLMFFFLLQFYHIY